MAQEILNVNPTRMELLHLKKKTKLAKKGHKLLKEKNEGMVRQFMEIVRRTSKLRSKTEVRLAEAFEALIAAQVVNGAESTEVASLLLRRRAMLSITTTGVMNVKTPAFLLEVGDVGLERGYSIAGTTSEVDEAAKRFEEVLEDIVKLGEAEKSIKVLALEIERTRRRVNALEYVLIPKLEATVRYIKMKLDEMERSSFVQLKKIKAKTTA
ncbi:MAG: V-type ATP synthase subunit D [Methanopyri archaeon]|nr:V-type ATP synthase subunit D [Methanopyri archaeon]